MSHQVIDGRYWQELSVKVVAFIADKNADMIHEDEATIESLVCPELKEHVRQALLCPGQSLDVLLEKLTDSGHDVSMFEDIDVPTVKAINGTVHEMAVVKRKVEAQSDLLQAAEDLSSGEWTRGRMATDRIRNVLEKINTDDVVGSEHEPLDIVSDPDRMVNVVEERKNLLGTGTVFDTWMTLAPGELGLLMAMPGVGKTTGLVTIGSGYALQQEGLVIHFSEEMVQDAVGIKYFNHFTQGNSTMAHRMKAFKKMEMPGRVIVESHPSGTSSVGFLIKRVEQIHKAYKKTRGEDLPITTIIIDYVGLLTAQMDARFDMLSEVIVSMRAMGSYFSCPMWSAHQPRRPRPAMGGNMPTNMQAIQFPVLEMADVSECWAIPQVVDLLISLNQTKEEAEALPVQARMHRAKARWPKPDAPRKLTYGVTINYEDCVFS